MGFSSVAETECPLNLINFPKSLTDDRASFLVINIGCWFERNALVHHGLIRLSLRPCQREIARWKSVTS